MTATLFTRAGHLNDLSIDRFVDGEAAVQAPIKDHLGDCTACRQRVDEARAFDLTMIILPMRQSKRRWWPATTAIAAAAAGLLIVILSTGTDDAPAPAAGLRSKGPGFRVDVFAHDGNRDRRVTSGGRVRAGERLGFRVKTRTAGYLLIVGHDQRGNSYICYPQRTGGTAAHITPTAQPRPLEQAIRFDDIPGRESIYAVFCPTSFTLDDITPVNEGDPPLLPPGCIRQIHLLEKE